MFEILIGNERFEELDESGRNEIETMRKEFSVFNITDPRVVRPVKMNEKTAEIFTFTGTKINRTLAFLIDLAEVKFIFDSLSGSFELDITRSDLPKVWSSLVKFLTEIDSHIENLLQTNPGVLSFSKWGEYLPVKYQIELIKNSFFGPQHFIEIEIGNFRHPDNTEITGL